METPTRKAGVLIEALAWIRRFRGGSIVIKLGGSVMDDADAVRRFLTDVIFLETVGCRPILVHGGGKAINRALAEHGIESRFVRGRRYTDEATLEIAAKVLTDDVCGHLVREIEALGGHAIGLTDRDGGTLRGEVLTLPPEEPGGPPTDLGRVGRVVGVHRERIERVTAAGLIPVVPCIAVDDDGGRLNVNADTAAAALARDLKAEKLMFLSDVSGIYRNPSEPDSLISHLDQVTCRELIAEGVISSGMVPKVEAALDALAAGVGKVHIVDARMSHSVLLEIFSDRGVGTEIVGG